MDTTNYELINQIPRMDRSTINPELFEEDNAPEFIETGVSELLSESVLMEAKAQGVLFDHVRAIIN